MTTIAASFRRMAADSRLVTSSGCMLTTKLLFTKRGIAGAAGDAAACNAVIEWLDGKAKKPRIRKSAEFQCLLLNPEGLFLLEYDLSPNPVLDYVSAIGSGAAYAFGSMERDLSLGLEPDPVAAVRAACARDENTHGPVAFLTLPRLKHAASNP